MSNSSVALVLFQFWDQLKMRHIEFDCVQSEFTANSNRSKLRQPPQTD